jgi:hypothetical protein
MSPEELFSLANTAVLPGWAILVLAPRRWPFVNAIPAFAIPLGLSALYTMLVLAHFSEPGGGYGTLAQVRQLFTSDMVLVAGWVHYLAFDLFIGAWAARRMDRAGIIRVIQAFVLATIFMFGPAGLLLALAIEAFARPLPRPAVSFLAQKA